MAREYELSRTTIYEIAERMATLFEPRLPGPVQNEWLLNEAIAAPIVKRCPILYFIVVAQAYLLLPFRDATLLTLFFILALGLDYLIIAGPSSALSILLHSGGFVFFAAVSPMAARQREKRERAKGLLAELEETPIAGIHPAGGGAGRGA